jgi:hypothetical protein
MIDRLIGGFRDFSRLDALPRCFNQFTTSLHRFSASRTTELHGSAIKQIAVDIARGFNTIAHHGVMVVGILAIGTLGVMFVRPDVMDELKTLSPFHAVSVDGAASVHEGVTRPTVAAEIDAQLLAGANLPALTANDVIEARRFSVSSSRLQNTMVGLTGINGGTGSSNNVSFTQFTQPLATQFASFPRSHANQQSPGAYKQQTLVTNWLAKKYRVASDATDMLVSAAYSTAGEIKLDPLLILSVMAIESGFNPFAESPVGAQGLMQVMSKLHHEKFQHLGGLKAALNPVANIKVGSLILKDYVTRGGSVEAGLKLYVGAAAFDNDLGYGSKVLAEYRRLKDVAGGKTVNTTPPIFTAKAKPAMKTVDSLNTAPDKDENAASPANDNKPGITATVAAI